MLQRNMMRYRSVHCPKDAILHKRGAAKAGSKIQRQNISLKRLFWTNMSIYIRYMIHTVFNA